LNRMLSMILGFSLKLNPGLSPNRSCKKRKVKTQDQDQRKSTESMPLPLLQAGA
jgi:hypothetical protein